MNHDQIRFWLERALRDEEPLPRLTPDESPYLGIVRVDKSLNPAARKSLRDGVLNLLRQFSDRGAGIPSYVEELLSLASALSLPETAGMLADLALRFPELPDLPLDVRYAVLGALVDASPPQETSFWERILKQDPANYGLLALAGVLATNPFYAIKMLPAMPDTERAGQAAALNLDLAWDDQLPKDRPKFVEQIQNQLRQCRPNFAAPLKEWVEAKRPTPNPLLKRALNSYFGQDSNPRYHTPKLCDELPLAA